MVGNRRAALLALASVAWGGLLLLAAFFLPVASVATTRAGESPRETFVVHNGYGALWIACLPFALSAAGVILVHLGRKYREAVVAAYVVAGVLALGALAGTITLLIGIVVFPCAFLLFAACALTTTHGSGRNKVASGYGNGR